MPLSLNTIAKGLNSYKLKNYKEEIRESIKVEIERLRRDGEFSKDLEKLEYELWRRLFEKYISNEKVKELIKVFDSLNTLKFGIDYFTNTINNH